MIQSMQRMFSSVMGQSGSRSREITASEPQGANDSPMASRRGDSHIDLSQSQTCREDKTVARTSDQPLVELKEPNTVTVSVLDPLAKNERKVAESEYSSSAQQPTAPQHFSVAKVVPHAKRSTEDIKSHQKANIHPAVVQMTPAELELEKRALKLVAREAVSVGWGSRGVNNLTRAELFTTSEPAYQASNANEVLPLQDAFFSFLTTKNITQMVDLRTPDAVIDVKEVSSSSQRFGESKPGFKYYPEREGATMKTAYHSVKAVKVVEERSANQQEGNAPETIKHTTLEIQDLRDLDKPPHTIMIHHYDSWKDMAPIKPETLKYLSSTLEHNGFNKGNNSMIHCRGGSGRTGTLLNYLQMRLRFEMDIKEKVQSSELDNLVNNNVRTSRASKLEHQYGEVEQLLNQWQSETAQEFIAASRAEGKGLEYLPPLFEESPPVFVETFEQLDLIKQTLAMDYAR